MFGAFTLGCLLTTLIYAISWISTCGLVALVCRCLGWEFSWLVATGVWLAAVTIRALFK